MVAAESADKKVAAEVAVVGRIKKARAPIKANDRSQRGLPRSERKGGSECGRANVGIEKIWSVETRERERERSLGDWGMLNNGGGIPSDAQRASPPSVPCCAAVPGGMAEWPPVGAGCPPQHSAV